MSTTTNFFASRTAARTAAAQTLTGKFVDQGADSPKGQRWSVTNTVNAVTKAKSPSKMDLARAVVEKHLAKKSTRAVALDALTEEAGLTRNGANTYWYKIKSQLQASA